MSKVHITDDGRALHCDASINSCKYGEHYGSEEEYHQALEQSHGLLPSHSKSQKRLKPLDDEQIAVEMGSIELYKQRAATLQSIAGYNSLVQSGILLSKPKGDSVFTRGSRERAKIKVRRQILDLERLDYEINQRNFTNARKNIASLDDATMNRYKKMSRAARRKMILALRMATENKDSQLADQKDVGEILEQIEEANNRKNSSTPAGRWIMNATASDMANACKDMLSKGTVTVDELNSMGGKNLMERLNKHLNDDPSLLKAQSMKRNTPPVANPDTYTAEEFVDALESEREKPKVHTQQRRAPGIAGTMGALKAVRIEEPNEREMALSEYRRTLSPTQQDLINTMMGAKSIGASQGVIDQINNAYKHEKAIAHNRAWNEALQEQRVRDQIILNDLRDIGVSTQGAGGGAADDIALPDVALPTVQLPPAPATPDPREYEWRNAMKSNAQRSQQGLPIPVKRAQRSMERG